MDKDSPGVSVVIGLALDDPPWCGFRGLAGLVELVRLVGLVGLVGWLFVWLVCWLVG